MPTPELPVARANLDHLVDVALGTGGETTQFDFKQSLDLSDVGNRIKLIRSIAAFGNTDGGGFVLVGFSDSREVVGLPEDIATKYDQTAVHQCVSQYLSPTPRFQVRHHTRGDKRIVIIEVDSFSEIPSIVVQSAKVGEKEKLTAGTIIFRNAAAQSAVVTTESDMRLLCDAIARRRAATIMSLLRGHFPETAGSNVPQFEGISELRATADAEWPPQHPASPVIEVAFCPEHPLNLRPRVLRHILETAKVPTKYGFPFLRVESIEVTRPTSWGCYGRIPFAELQSGDPPPSYFWALSRKGSFLDRDYLWEDENSSMRGAAGLFHIVGRTILLLRFLEAFARASELPEDTKFRVAVGANGVLNRVLLDETGGRRGFVARGASEASVESHSETTLQSLRTSARSICTDLIEDVAEQFGREDIKRHELELLISRAPSFLGEEYVLPAGG